jgi:L-alanine-DL-glutamate epimerase-like enolase superfamily enzyme
MVLPFSGAVHEAGVVTIGSVVVKVTSVEAIPLAASFKHVFRFGTTDRSTSPNVIVRIATDDGVVGYGEACPVQAFTSETQASVVELVETRVAPTLVGRDALQRVPRLADLARVLRFAPFTFAAVDTALLDLAGRHAGVPVSTLLGGAFRNRVEVHGSVSWDEDPARVVASVLEHRETYRWLKLYAGRDEVDRDLDRLQAVRNAVGPDARLMVDVNGLWRPSDAIRALGRARAIGVELIEQPLPPAAAPFQRDLVARLAVDIAADESVRSVAEAATVVRERTATVVNVGMSKLGGPTAALQAAQLAAAGGVGVMVGSVIEMGIATAMGLHLAAALPHLAYPSYLMSPLKYREQITAERIAVVDAHVAVPCGPGLGVDVDEDALRHLDARARR